MNCVFSIYLVPVKLLYKEIVVDLVHPGHWVNSTILSGTCLVGRWDLHKVSA